MYMNMLMKIHHIMKKETVEIDFDEMDEETLIWHSRELGWME